MDNKLANLADRLKAKLGGSKEQVHADDNLTDLVDAHLDLVSAAHGSAHLSGHASGGRDPVQIEQ